MKKYLLVIFLTILILPSITFASWWNPFTWKIFHRTTEVKIEKTVMLPTDKVASSSERTDSVTQSVKSTEVNKKITPKNSITPIKPSTQVQNTPVAPTPPQNTISCNGQYWTTCPEGQEFRCPATGGAYCERTTQTQPVQNNSNDSLLKIERCKAQRDQSRANLETTVQGVVNLLANNYANQLLVTFQQSSGTMVSSDFSGLIAEYKLQKTIEIEAKYDQMANDEYSKCINQ